MQQIKTKLLHYAKEILLFIVVMTLFANALSFYKSAGLNKESLALQSVTLIDGDEYTIDPSKPIILHFWATWCPTCKLEADNIERLSRNYNLLTFAVQSQSNKEIKKYLQEKELDFHVVNDRNSYYAKKFHISAFPTTFIYDKNQKLLFSEVGYTSTLGLFLRAWWASL